MSERPRVVIIGGGFAGLNAARSLSGAPVDVLLLDRTNHHLFQPLLYQVAAAALSPRDIARPLRDVLRRQKNATVLMAEVSGFDVEHQEVRLADCETIHYDYLIVAIGARHSYFGRDDWETKAPGLKTLADALELRRRILLEFERAERTASRNARQGKAGSNQPDLTFVVIGGGPTGVEMAGAIAEIAKKTMQRDFRSIHPEATRTLLVEASPRVLLSFPEELSVKAKNQLEALGVEVRTSTRVTELGAGRVRLEQVGEGKSSEPEELEANCVVWAAGNVVSGVLSDLPAERDRGGRVHVAADLALAKERNIFVLGDAAYCLDQNGRPLPALAPVAMQQGKVTAANIRRDLRGEPRKPFSYRDRGSMATIGKARGVAWIGRLRFGGALAWLAWSWVHILFLIGFRTRIVVMLEWIYLYLFSRRDARLIHGWNSRECAAPLPLEAVAGEGGVGENGISPEPEDSKQEDRDRED